MVTSNQLEKTNLQDDFKDLFSLALNRRWEYYSCFWMSLKKEGQHLLQLLWEV